MFACLELFGSSQNTNSLVAATHFDDYIVVIGRSKIKSKCQCIRDHQGICLKCIEIDKYQ